MKNKEIKLQDHINMKSHKSLMKKLKQMTPEELFQSCVVVGIYNPDGTLTKQYSNEDDKNE